MDHLFDDTRTIDLNPRQIYIILREDNRRFRSTFESLVKATANNDIRFCIIDTTAIEEKPEQGNQLYQDLMEGGEDSSPWDLLVRDYPLSKKHFSFTVEHLKGDNAEMIRKQLIGLQQWQAQEITDTISRIIRQNLVRSTAAFAKSERFRDLLHRIQQSRGFTEEESLRNMDKLEEAFSIFCKDSSGRKDALRDFVGDQTHLLDSFFGAGTPRNLSDDYMTTFMETGQTSHRPGVYLVKTTGEKGTHARYALEFHTRTGEVFRPHFSSKPAFEMYIFYMRNPGLHVRRENFDMHSGFEYSGYFCQMMAAIHATLNENLFGHTGEALQDAEKACMEFFPRIYEDKKYWDNRNNHCDQALQAAMKEEALPFMIQPVKGSAKPERWINLSEDYIHFCPEYKEELRRNLKHIIEKGLFSQLKGLHEAPSSPIFTANDNKKLAEKMKNFVKNDSRISCMGSGQYNFDRIMVREYPEGFETGRRNPFKDRIHTEEVGGTCGNVMCMLSYWGWRALPQAQFDMSREGYQMKKDFKRYGCDVSFVENIPEGGTSLLDCIHRRNKDTGEHELGRKGYGPNGSMHPKRKQLRAKDEVPQVLERMQDVPDVYFFDSNEAGPRALAEGLRRRGSMVYYESEGFDTENEFHRCVEVADIVKFSVEHIKDLSICDKYRDKLFIQTLGGDGLRFRLRDGEWIHLDAEPVQEVVDWEGCGDTTTATFLYMLGNMGRLDVSKLEESSVRTALETAMRMAAKCTQYYGSKGWIHASKSFKPQPDNVRSPYDHPAVIAAFQQQNEEDHTKVTSLEKIPEKDYREYDIKDSMIYYSGGEMLKGRELKIKRGDCSVLSNFYTCRLQYDGREFTSAEQVYHYYRFRETPLIQEMIMQCKTGNQVKAACGGFTFRPKNHQVTRWRYMTLAIELKYLQCKEFRQKLLSLGDTPLVESTPGFDFFGSTVPGTHKKVGGVFKGHDVSDKYIGMNGCGRCMMAVRDKFKGWTEAQLKAYVPSSDLEEWWNSSPDYLELLDGMGLE